MFEARLWSYYNMFGRPSFSLSQRLSWVTVLPTIGGGPKILIQMDVHSFIWILMKETAHSESTRQSFMALRVIDILL